eukprot:1167629_1
MPHFYSLSTVIGAVAGVKLFQNAPNKQDRVVNYIKAFKGKHFNTDRLQHQMSLQVCIADFRSTEKMKDDEDHALNKLISSIEDAECLDELHTSWIQHEKIMADAIDHAMDIEKKGKKHTEPHIAPAHANVQSVISPNGGIYHPCHGYSQRDISIFDLFPGIVKYQSKKYAECDRVDYLVSLSEKSFCSVNNKPLKVNEAEMWYTALKYLFNDITLGQFDYMSVEMRYVIKQYMSTHKNRLSFLKSIKSYGFLRVISDVSKKLPREHIQKIMKQEREKKEKQEREKLVALQKQIRYQQLIQQQQMYQQQLYQQHEATHYADWYTGSKLKRTVSEPPPLTASYKPCIVDEEDDDIDDSWNFITEIVNNNKIPDLPPEREHTHSSSPSTHTSDDDEAKEQEEMNEIVDVYTMLYQTMKDKEGPDVSLADLTTIEQHDTFTPKVN